MPSDESYTVYELEQSRLILPQMYRPLATKFSLQIDSMLKLYREEFHWQLDDRAANTVASAHTQEINAYTFNYPYLGTIFYPNGTQILDASAAKSWAQLLIVHEFAHLYQLNQKGPVSSVLYSVFGTSELPFVVLPLFTQPNDLLPDFVLEGNAVFNESRFGLGGRLYSGEVRAQVYELIKDQKINLKRLMNNHLEFPFGSEKYYVGGYFMEYLAKRFGLEKTNGFFKNHRDHWINPFLLNRSFVATFGLGYEDLFQQFLNQTLEVAKNQKTNPNAPLVTAFFNGPLNSDENQVTFVAQTDGRSQPRLLSINKKTLEVHNEGKNLETGKVFFNSNLEPVVAAPLRYSVRRLQYSLYGENAKFYPEHKNQIVQDIRAAHTLTIDAENSLFENRLLLDNKFFAQSHSSAILDDKGSVYYFKQDHSKKVLFKNHEEIARFDGFYAKLTEVTPDGKVFFIANTPYGSSLFSFNGAQFERHSDSDVIVDARFLNDNKIVAVEVSSEGYQTKIIDQVAQSENPAVYHYFFDKTPDFEKFQNNFPLGSKPHSHSYFEPFQMRYSSAVFGALMSPFGLGGASNITFVDPLEYNTLSLTYQTGFKHAGTGLLSYQNNRHVVSYTLGALYDEDRLLDNQTILSHHYNHTVFLDLNSPLWIRGRWKSALISELSYEHLDETNYAGLIAPAARNLGLSNTLQFRFSESYPLSFVPHRDLNFTIAHKYVTDGDRFKIADNVVAAKVSGSIDLGKENIISADGGSGFSQNHNIAIDDTFALHPTSTSFTPLIPGISSSTPGFATRALEVKEASFGYQKVINRGIYSSVIPVSLRRFAPFARAQYFWYRERTSLPFSQPNDVQFWQYLIGSDFDVLIAHKAAIKLSAAYVNETLTRTGTGFMLNLSTQLAF